MMEAKTTLMKWDSLIISVGKYSRYVRLPIDWIHTNELIPGDSVQIELLPDGALKVVPLKRGIPGEVGHE